MAVRLASEMGGSSPRGRGKRDALAPGVGDPGLIPARAGKTGCARARRRRSRAHPRAGGENQHRLARPGHPHGSSPRGRGKPSWSKPPTLTARLIPARAGKTPPTPSPHCRPRAHPRAGGENPGQLGAGIVGAGSSPRGRGKPDWRRRRLVGSGLIPARAGKTNRSGVYVSYSPAHPRAGGENRRDGAGGPLERGSSPRGRGKPFDSVDESLDERLIPARAEKTR